MSAVNNKQLSIAYATAKILGYEKSVDDFKEEVNKIYNETLNELNSRPVKLAKAEAVQNPFRTSKPF